MQHVVNAENVVKSWWNRGETAKQRRKMAECCQSPDANLQKAVLRSEQGPPCFCQSPHSVPLRWLQVNPTFSHLSTSTAWRRDYADICWLSNRSWVAPLLESSKHRAPKKRSANVRVVVRKDHQRERQHILEWYQWYTVYI
jgi:hypothetical protein